MYISQITVDRIKELRESKGISAAELNKVCDLSKNTIAASANGKNGLSAKILFDVAKFLDCSVDYLLGVTDEPNGSTGNINGDNSIQANGLSANGNVNLSAGEPKLDELSAELVKNFNVLTTTQKARIIVMIDEMKKGA